MTTNLVYAEESVIGAIMGFDAYRECCELNADDFSEPFCRAVFAIEKELYEKGEKIDIISVGRALECRTGDANSKKLLVSAAGVPTAANIRTYVRIVKDASRRRQIRKMAIELAEKVNDTTIEVDTLIDEFKNDAARITDGRSDWMSASEMSMKGFEWLEAKNAGKITCIQSGISTLDYMIGGFYQSELTVIAARPAVGKSALGLFIGLNAARTGKKVAMVSREMAPEAIFQRAVSNESTRLSGQRIRKSVLNEEEWVAVADAINDLSHLPLSTIYSVKTVEQLHRQAMTLKDRQGLDLLIVDYAQLMHTDRKANSRVDELETVSGAMKDIAMDLKIPVLALAQVKRSGSRIPVMPTMDELKGSGAFEQDADGIILIHRCDTENDEYVNKKDLGLYQAIQRDGKQYIALNVAKQRQGKTGIVNLVFDPNHMMYTAIDRW